ncbi:MAG: hypothetical protein WCR78_07530 [Arcobacteraceae bacterium]
MENKKDFKYSNKFIIVAKMIHLEAKSLNYERGIITKECKRYGFLYGIKYENLISYVSYIKFYNNENKKSFSIRKRYKVILGLINKLSLNELEQLLEIVIKSDKNFDLLLYLLNEGENNG